MGFINGLFGSSDSQTTNFDWQLLNSVAQLDDLVEESNEKPIVIFKHSTRCSISRMALKQFEKSFNIQDKVTPYFLDLIKYREVSNEIASRFNVYHQSPQIILIQKGKSIYNASHNDIDADVLGSKI